MEPKIVRHGIKYIFSGTRIDHVTCPECEFVSAAVAGNWKDVWMVGDEGKEVGVGYECSRCLCKFEFYKKT
jgi:hypothetical protein